MTTKKKLVERRQQKRFQARDGAFVILKSPHTGMGPLIDIGMDGLRFDYVSWRALPVVTIALDIFLTGSAFSLYDAPCRSIWGETIYETPPSPLYWKRCGVQFGELTPDQISQLEYFIENHTTGEVEA
jgi:hypothetical protein